MRLVAGVALVLGFLIFPFKSYSQTATELFAQVNQLYEEGKKEEGKTLFIRATELILNDSSAKPIDQIAAAIASFKIAPFAKQRHLNLTRSARHPVINAGVIMANFNWNIANNKNGIVPAKTGFGSEPTFLKLKNVLGSPIIPPILSPKAKLKPTTTHKTLITPRAIKLCNMVEITLFLFTIPP